MRVGDSVNARRGDKISSLMSHFSVDVPTCEWLQSQNSGSPPHLISDAFWCAGVRKKLRTAGQQLGFISSAA